MSWQNYIDTLKTHAGADDFNCGAICSRSNGSIWAASCGFAPTTAEILPLAKSLMGDCTEEEQGLQQNGVFASGVKYRYLKKVDGGEGLQTLTFALGKGDEKFVGCAALTETAVVMCICVDKGAGNKAVTAASVVAKHLKVSNY